MPEDSSVVPDALDLSKVHLLLQAGAKAQARKLAPSSLRAYRADWRTFSEWCAAKGQPSLPAAPETVAVFLASEVEAGRKVQTIERRRHAIRFVHEQNGHPTPTRADIVMSTMSAIRRACQQPQESRRPLRVDEMLAIAQAIDRTTLAGARDAAILTTMWCGALRRSELVALDVGDMQWPQTGLSLIRRGDRQRHDERIPPIPARADALCAVTAMSAWLTMSGIDEGPVFREVDRHGNVSDDRLSGRAIPDVVKKWAAAIGLDSAEYSSSSLRSGFFESAADAGAHDRDIMWHGRVRCPGTMHKFTAGAPIVSPVLSPKR